MRTFFCICFLLLGLGLFAQRLQAQDDHTRKAEEKVNEVKKKSVDQSIDKTKALGKGVKDEASQVKSSVKDLSEKVKTDSIPKPDLKKTSKTAGQILEKKATNLNYDSDNPDDAPWKKQQFSKDDLKDFDLKSSLPKGEVPSVNGDKANVYKDKIEDLKPSAIDEQKIKDQLSKTGSGEIDKARQAGEKINDLRSNPVDEKQIRDEVSKKVDPDKLAKVQKAADSLMAIKDRIEASNLEQELMGAKKVYSEKYIRRIYDSLGIEEADKLFKMGSALAKKEIPKDELLDKINSPLKEKAGEQGIGFDEKTQSLKMADADKLNGLPDQFSATDISSLKLPQDVMSELKPLSGRLMDSKYMPLIDSAREVAMKLKGYKLDEKQITEEVKSAALRKKPSFLDKSYVEGILGFVNDSTISIVQISPAWAYHFTDNISVGLGPNISVEYQQKKINAVAGFRSFAKAEFWKQRVYLQVEDNFTPSKINREVMKGTTHHSVLLGGGGLLPLSKKLAINVAVFYRVNQQAVKPGGSPWVFRIGLSSMKKISKD